jgi:hypothetical protein
VSARKIEGAFAKWRLLRKLPRDLTKLGGPGDWRQSLRIDYDRRRSLIALWGENLLVVAAKQRDRRWRNTDERKHEQGGSEQWVLHATGHQDVGKRT